MAEYQHQPHLDSIETNLIALVDSTSPLRRGFTTIASSLAENKLLLQEILNLLPPLTNQEQSHEEPEGLLNSTEIHTIGAIVDAEVFDEMLQPTSEETWLFGDNDDTEFIDNEDKAIESQEQLTNISRDLIDEYTLPVALKGFDSGGRFVSRALLIGFDFGIGYAHRVLGTVGTYFHIDGQVEVGVDDLFLTHAFAYTKTFDPGISLVNDKLLLVCRRLLVFADLHAIKLWPFAINFGMFVTDISYNHKLAAFFWKTIFELVTLVVIEVAIVFNRTLHEAPLVWSVQFVGFKCLHRFYALVDFFRVNALFVYLELLARTIPSHDQLVQPDTAHFLLIQLTSCSIRYEMILEQAHTSCCKVLQACLVQKFSLLGALLVASSCDASIIDESMSFKPSFAGQFLAANGFTEITFSAFCVDFMMGMMNFKLSFASKLHQAAFIPKHLALHNGNIQAVHRLTVLAKFFRLQLVSSLQSTEVIFADEFDLLLHHLEDVCTGSVRDLMSWYFNDFGDNAPWTILDQVIDLRIRQLIEYGCKAMRWFFASKITDGAQFVTRQAMLKNCTREGVEQTQPTCCKDITVDFLNKISNLGVLLLNSREGEVMDLMDKCSTVTYPLELLDSTRFHWMLHIFLFTNCVEHVEQQVTPLVLVDSEASYMLQPLSILVKLMLQHATFVMTQWLIPWDRCYSLAFNLEDKVVLKGGVML